jgi:hypothetical protein
MKIYYYNHDTEFFKHRGMRVLLGRKLAELGCSRHIHSQLARRGAFPPTAIFLAPNSIISRRALPPHINSPHFLSPLNAPRIGYRDLESEADLDREKVRSSWRHWDPGDSTAAASRGRASSPVATTASIRWRPSTTRSSPGPTRRTGPWAATASSASDDDAGDGDSDEEEVAAQERQVVDDDEDSDGSEEEGGDDEDEPPATIATAAQKKRVRKLGDDFDRVAAVEKKRKPESAVAAAPATKSAKRKASAPPVRAPARASPRRKAAAPSADSSLAVGTRRTSPRNKH